MSLHPAARFGTRVGRIRPRQTPGYDGAPLDAPVDAQLDTQIDKRADAPLDTQGQR